jgi:hypothetical protein
MNSNELISQAEQMLEKNQYSDAAKFFQQAALTRLPSASHLMNWSVAQEQAQLTALKEVAGKYPASLECHLGVISQLFRMGLQGQAAVYCTHLLGSFPDLTDELQIRLLRFRAAQSCGKHEHVVEDFLKIWQAQLDRRPLNRLRSRLLLDIATTNDVRLLPVFEELEQNQNVSTQVRDFLSAKRKEIKLLQELMK